MNKNEFMVKWIDADDPTHLRDIKFYGGSMYANGYTFVSIRTIIGEKTEIILKVDLLRDVGGVIINVGRIEMSKIRNVI